jgi:Mn-dependent DtxR family transcriptional regulator
MLIVDRKRSKFKDYIIKIFEKAKKNNENITSKDIARILTIRYQDACKLCNELKKELECL